MFDAIVLVLLGLWGLGILLVRWYKRLPDRPVTDEEYREFLEDMQRQRSRHHGKPIHYRAF
jgi:hypothetical protein